MRAHKIVLGKSPVFRTMFYGVMAQQNDKSNATHQDMPIKVPDVQPRAFRQLMEYISFMIQLKMH